MSHIANRELVEQALRDELFGPAPHGEEIDCTTPIHFETWQESNGPWRQAGSLEEILQRDRPTKRYGIGVLYPIGIENELENAESSDNDSSPEGVSEESSISADAVAQVDQLGAETEPANMPSEVDGYDLDLSGANTYRPSSLGISFLAEIPDDGELQVVVRGGRYRPVSVTIGESETFSPRWWLRSGVSPEPILYSLQQLRAGVQESRPLNIGDDFNFSIEVFARPRPEENQFLITVSLVNRNNAANEADSVCLFQTELSATALSANGSSEHILPYPSRSFDELNSEERSFALLDRMSPTFAIGHGCAGDWRAQENSLRATQAVANCLPSHELPSFTPDIQRADGSGPLSVSMRPLAGLNSEDDGMTALEEVVVSYEQWIERERSRIDELPDHFRQTARAHMDSCYSCAGRMRSGLDYLRDPQNENVRLAFQLANRAILLQQLMTVNREPRNMVFDSQMSCIRFEEPYQEVDISQEVEGRGNWRAFQIAFFLMSLESTANGESPDRDRVELIWFPTGGGKTEAYSALAAFSMFYRRLADPDDVGVDVLMRYTLRLLTAQQFQRATALICAMGFIRRQPEFSPLLGNSSFSIGIWVGGENTPNRREDATRELGQLEGGRSRQNRFLVTKCPWCRAQIGPIDYPRNRPPRGAPTQMGYQRESGTVKIHCSDTNCVFADGIPVVVIDEDIYDFRPTMVIGTVDKFAMLAWKPAARSLFGIGGDGQREVSPPTLIIQDELHLISGPLGSMAGLYEGVIEELATDRRRGVSKPKIVSSTATICRYQDQIRALYGRVDQHGETKVTLFPPPGIDAGDSFFAVYRRLEDGSLAPGRRYIGVHGAGLGSLQTAQVRTFSSLLQGAMEFDGEQRDPWWTLLSFFNSLRELGTSLSLLQSDIPNYLKTIRQRKGLAPSQSRYLNRIKELTGRLRDDEVPKAISELEVQVTANRTRAVDVCLASNIIEVGVDIDRLSLMTVVGQPKTTSQYIQVTGRVGRKRGRPGLVVTIYSASKPRDRSHFEKFRSYHSRLNAQVEPTSVTPFSPPSLDRALHAAMVAYIRQVGDSQNTRRPTPFPSVLIAQLRDILRDRIREIDPNELANFERVFSLRADEWERWQRERWQAFGTGGQDAPLLRFAGSYVDSQWAGISWPTPTSLRNVDAECQAEITNLYLDDNTQLTGDENA